MARFVDEDCHVAVDAVEHGYVATRIVGMAIVGCGRSVDCSKFGVDLWTVRQTIRKSDHVADPLACLYRRAAEEVDHVYEGIGAVFVAA